MKRRLFGLVLLLLILLGLAACDVIFEEEIPLEEPLELEELVDYLASHGELPDYFITKSQAQKLGWDSSQGNLWEVAKGRVIGGDRFYNREGLLPEKKGRLYYECDIDYSGGRRGAKRLVYSSDGLFFYTEDHYSSFREIKVD